MQFVTKVSAGLFSWSSMSLPKLPSPGFRTHISFSIPSFTFRNVSILVLSLSACSFVFSKIFIAYDKTRKEHRARVVDLVRMISSLETGDSKDNVNGETRELSEVERKANLSARVKNYERAAQEIIALQDRGDSHAEIGQVFDKFGFNRAKEYVLKQLTEEAATKKRDKEAEELLVRQK